LPLITDATAIFVYLVVLIGLLHWISERPFLSGFFKYLPPAIWVYFLPMISSNIGIIPQSHDLYDWIRQYLLPSALVLMLLSANVPALAKLGGKAILTMCIGTLGIATGAIASFTLYHFWLPEESWKAVGALTASWVGGSANMVAVATSVGTPDTLLGPIIVVDTVVGYGWMGVVIALAVFQRRLDDLHRVDHSIVEGLNQRMAELDEQHRRPIKFNDLVKMVAIGFGIGYAMLEAGRWMPDVGTVLNSFGWTIILVTIVGIVLSLTPVSRLEYAGASIVGSAFFYLLLASIGAKADLKGILDAPMFLLFGITIIAIHATFLWIAGRYLRSPMFLMATASQANIGGPVTAPIVATVYQSSLAPVGLLMAVMGNVMGTFVGLTVAQICSMIAE
jgi:uncharacterized membrane protein